MKAIADTRRIDQAFAIGLLLKAVFAFGELAGGLVVGVTTQRFWVDLVRTVTAGELAEDPHDLVANFLERSVAHVSGGSLHFAAWYLLGHGVVKLWLIAGLLRRRPAYYPLAMAVFGALVCYQLYRFHLNHSIFLLLLTALDVAVIVLTAYEYRTLRAAARRA